MQEDATSIHFLEELSDLLVGFKCYSQRRAFCVHSVSTMQISFSETAFQNSCRAVTGFFFPFFFFARKCEKKLSRGSKKAAPHSVK